MAAVQLPILFKSFSERLSEVNIEVARKIHKVSAVPENRETFFHEGLERWKVLDATRDYENFRQVMSYKVESLAQLIHNKDVIAKDLLHHLSKSHNLAVITLMDLLVQFARDLLSDFYEYFPSYFKVLLNILNDNRKSAEIVESVFTTLAYLFKFLWRTMVKDIENLFWLFTPLLGGKGHYVKYIKQFAAESFGFLMRKVKDTDKLYTFLFTVVVQKPEIKDGVGRLIFTSITGINGCLHSQAEKVLSAIFDNMCNTTVPVHTVSTTLNDTWQKLLEYINPKSVELIWKIIIKYIKKTHKQITSTEFSEKERGQAMVTLEHFLMIVQFWANHEKGKLLLKPLDDIVACLQNLIDSDSLLNDECAMILLKLFATFFLEKHSELKPTVRYKIVQKVYNSNYDEKLVYYFTEQCFDAPLFCKDFVPCLVRYCNKKMSKKSTQTNALFTLTQLVIRFDQSDNRTTGLLNMEALDHSKHGSLCGFIECVINEAAQQFPTNNDQISNFWAALTCLPHIIPTMPSSLSKLPKLCTQIVDILVKKKQESNTDVLLLVLRCCVTMVTNSKSSTGITKKAMWKLISLYSDNCFALSLALHYFEHASEVKSKKGALKADDLIKNFSAIEMNLSSAVSEIRLLTLKLCQLFTFDYELPPVDMVVEQVGVFAICLEAEEIDISYQTFRDRLRVLRKLMYDSARIQTPKGCFENVALRYLIGALYINFTPMQSDVMEFITSHMTNMDNDAFWSVWKQYLNLAASDTENWEHFKSSDDLIYSEYHSLLAGQLTSKQPRTKNYKMFRELLWQCMTKVGPHCITQGKVLTTLLQRFMKNEYYDFNAHKVKRQSIRMAGNKPQDMEIDEEPSKEQSSEEETNDQEEASDKEEASDQEEASDEEEASDQEEASDEEEASDQEEASDEEEQEEESSDIDVGKSTSKVTVKKRGMNDAAKKQADKNLCGHLALFANMGNLKNMDGQQVLYDICLQLLMHTNAAIQGAAVKCLCGYQLTYITTYRDSLANLLDIKTINVELQDFIANNGNELIALEHRPQLMPILMRIFAGRLFDKPKDYDQTRLLLFRYIALLDDHERRLLYDMLFEPVKHFIGDNLHTTVLNIFQNINLSSVIPIAQLNSIQVTIDLLLRSLGHVMGDYSSNFFHIIVGMMATINAILQNIDSVKKVHKRGLKAIRLLGVQQITKYFQKFTDYDFKSTEIEGLFEAVVWVQLRRPDEVQYISEKGLLKLFEVWSLEPRFQSLLGKVDNVDSNLTAMPHIIQLLEKSSSTSHVKSKVIDIVSNLVNSVKDDETALITNIGKTAVKIVDSNSDDTFGMRLMENNAYPVLNYIHNITQKMLKGKMKQFQMREFQIINSFSKYKQNNDFSVRLIELLIPVLVAKVNKTEDVQRVTVEAISQLTQWVDEPRQFVQPILRLFGNVESRTVRSGLCAILTSIGTQNEFVRRIANIVTDMNSWNPRHLEEPNYEKRLSAYRAARDWITSEPMAVHDESVIILILYNCTFFINNLDDISLRDGASYCIQDLLKTISTSTDNDKIITTFVTSRLLQRIKENLSHKNEAVHTEYIRILHYCIEYFPSYQPFTELQNFISEDKSTDVLHNLSQVKISMKENGLQHLVKLLSTTESIQDKTICTIVMPLVTIYTENVHYNIHDNLVRLSIQAVNSVCLRLQWSSYYNTLVRYVKHVTKANKDVKLNIVNRILISVLEAFHFDLQNAVIEGSFEAPSKKDTQINQPPDDDVEEMDLSEPVDKSGYFTCDANLATNIHDVITADLLPQLYATMTVTKQAVHKKSEKKVSAGRDDMLRIPIALAMIKLIKELPEVSMRNSLCRVILHICNLLTSQSKAVRKRSRTILANIVRTLGSSHIPYVLEEMQRSLKTGFQKHVLCYSIYKLLSNLSEKGVVKHGDLDSEIPKLSQIFLIDSLGVAAEQKEIDKILDNVPEARENKTGPLYQLLGRFVSKTALLTLLGPLIEQLQSTKKKRHVLLLEDLLHNIQDGLSNNDGLDIVDLLTFSYGLITEHLQKHIDTMSEANKDLPKTLEEIDPLRFRKDSMILDNLGCRRGVVPKVEQQSNMHHIVQFGVGVFRSMLKSGKLDFSDLTHLNLIAPFNSTVLDSMSSKYNQLVILSLECLETLMVEYESLKLDVEQSITNIFVLLHRFAESGATHGDNQIIVEKCFKILTILIRDVNYNLSEKKVQVLLTYAEHDVYDYSRRATAFSFIEAIMDKKMGVKDIMPLMHKVKELTVQCADENIRAQSRSVIAKYLIDYPVDEDIKGYFDYFLKNLSYDIEYGRESSLEMLAFFYSELPLSMLHAELLYFFFPVAMRLVNEETSSCAKKANLVVKTFIRRLESDDRDALFTTATNWLNNSKAIMRRLGALTCALFVEIEEIKFRKRLERILPIIMEQFNPDLYSSDIITTDAIAGEFDLFLYSLGNLFLKVLRSASLLDIYAKYHELLDSIFAHIEQLLTYKHLWVQHVIAKIYGFVFAQMDVETFKEFPDQHKAYFHGNTRIKVNKLSVAISKQLSIPQMTFDMVDQVIKNLVFLGKATLVLTKREKDSRLKFCKDWSKIKPLTVNSKELSLTWLTKAICEEAQKEIPPQTIKRTAVYKWLAAMSLTLGADKLQPYLIMFLPLLLQSQKLLDSDLKCIGAEVLQLISGTVGVDHYTQACSEVQQLESDAHRLSDMAVQEEAILDPVSFYRKQVSHQDIEEMLVESSGDEAVDLYRKRKAADVTHLNRVKVKKGRKI